MDSLFQEKLNLWQHEKWWPGNFNHEGYTLPIFSQIPGLSELASYNWMEVIEIRSRMRIRWV
jgi:hypothetical protein